jgi:hypothetical protein
VKTLGFAVVVLFFALPAHAQSSCPHAAGGTASSHGSTNYVESTYVPYDSALDTGQTEFDSQHKSLGELAREFRAQKAAKADNTVNATALPPKKTRPRLDGN